MVFPVEVRCHWRSRVMVLNCSGVITQSNRQKYKTDQEKILSKPVRSETTRKGRIMLIFLHFTYKTAGQGKQAGAFIFNQ